MKQKRKRIRTYSFNPERFTKYSIGGLWHNHRKLSPEHPDGMGELDIPLILLEDLQRQFEKTGKAKISLASWNNTSKEGEQYLTLTGKLPRPIEKSHQ